MALEPITRAEQIMSGKSLIPITREEMFLAKAGGQDVQTPTPITRKEMFLQKIAENGGGSGGSGGENWIGDGNTHVWVGLPDFITSPILGVCPNGTVTVDWGDGTAPDTLTGTSTSTVKWTPRHNYASSGDYIITLTVDGKMGIAGQLGKGGFILLHAASGGGHGDTPYKLAVRKVEVGNDVANIGDYAFSGCNSLTSVKIPGSVTTIGSQAFDACYLLTSIEIPNGVKSVAQRAFQNCCRLMSVEIPDSVTSIAGYAFSNCRSLASIEIPNGVKSVASNTFEGCHSLTSVKIPDSVTSIAGYAFNGCAWVRVYDFTNHTAVPALSATNAFTYIPTDCEIRVPTALYDEWIAATNWSTYASNIVAV